MANAKGGNPPEHARWKKGQSGNPKGRPKSPLAGLSKWDLKKIIDRFSLLTEGELYAIKEHKSTPMMECIVAGCLLKAKEDASMRELEPLLNRSLGKVPDQLEILDNPEIEQLRKLSLKELILYLKAKKPEVLEG